MAIWPFNRKNNDVPVEIREYYQPESNSGLKSWLVGLTSLLLTVVFVLSVFLGGRWIYRQFANRGAEQATVQDSNNSSSTQRPNTGSSNNQNRGDQEVSSGSGTSNRSNQNGSSGSSSNSSNTSDSTNGSRNPSQTGSNTNSIPSTGTLPNTGPSGTDFIQ